MDKGFENAGYQRVWANDFDADAQAVFKLNLGEIDGRDITKVPVEDIPDCDIITAGFPCQPFSNAGNRRGVYDSRGELYLECLRIIEHKKPKQNLILEHNEDDELLKMYITAAVSYAESYQHIPENYYSENPMPPTTEQAVIMLASHFYESRDGSTGGFFADSTNASAQVWNTVNLLLRLDRRWQV